MKNLFIAAIFFSILQGKAQYEVATNVIKGDQLIEYVADHFPADEAQYIYVLVETGDAGIDLENQFYLKKGIDLLLKRLGENDQIALGVYGAVNGIILPFTSIESSELVFEKVESLFKGAFEVTNKDGIDLAYEHAKSNLAENFQSSVLMLRGTAKVSSVKKATLASAYDSKHTEEDISKKSETDKATSESLQQPKAASHSKLGGAIALTALTILPELLEIIKDER